MIRVDNLKSEQYIIGHTRKGTEVLITLRRDFKSKIHTRVYNGRIVGAIRSEVIAIAIALPQVTHSIPIAIIQIITLFVHGIATAHLHCTTT